MATPYLPAIDSYDIETGITISFTANNAYTAVKATRVFVEDATGNPIGNHLYTNSDTSIASTIHPLPRKSSASWVWNDATKYLNNKQIVIYIRTYIDAAGTIEMGTSNKVAVWCLPTPTIQIQIDEPTIESTSYNVAAIYTANNASVSNNVNEVQFSLYSKYNFKKYKANQLIAQSPIIYSSGIYIGNGQYQLNYEFEGLVNNCTYYITVDCKTSRNMTTSDGYNKANIVTPHVTIGSIDAVALTNNACDGCVDVRSYITKMEGQTASEVEPTITPDGIDLSEDALIFHDGLAFSSNYSVSFWGKDFTYAVSSGEFLEDYTLKFDGEYGAIRVYMVEDETHTYHKALMYVYPLNEFKGVVTYIESNEVEQPTGEHEFTCIGIQYKNARYSIVLTNVTVEPEP